MTTERKRRPSNDLDQFSDWYIQRRTRQAGRPPSPKTLQSRVGHLALCSRIAESGSRSELLLQPPRVLRVGEGERPPDPLLHESGRHSSRQPSDCCTVG